MTQAKLAFEVPEIARLDGKSSTLVLLLSRDVPEIAYFGERIPADVSADDIVSLGQRDAVPGALDSSEALTLLPETGTGFSAHSGVIAHRDGKTFISQLRLQRVEESPHCLTLHLSEQLSEYDVSIEISLHADSDVFEWNTSIRNTGTSRLTIDWLCSVSLALPSSFEYIGMFDGRWANEFQFRVQQLTTGSLRKENRLGRTAHNSFPAIVAGKDWPRWSRGTAIAVKLGWSGNHRLLIDRSRDGRPFVQMGELLHPRELELDRGESYTAPAAYVCHSSGGLNGLMQQFHRFVRQSLLRKNWRSVQRPVHFNTWEACYFDQSEEKVLDLVARAAKLGAERFVLDDGWFRGRNDARAGLGDWQPCPIKYPRGLEPVIDAVESEGMQVGLWIEPEMANADSDLARDHPEWLLGEPGRLQPTGRNQYALNLADPSVFEYLVSTIGQLIERYRLRYIKWDMNRDLTHAAIDSRPGYHQTTFAAYELLRTIADRYPETEIEICASGGARADYGALRFGSRIWPSDVQDPHTRQLLQRSFSLFFPPEVMGAHVGSKRDEITGREQTMAFRTASALLGHFGVEAHPAGLSDPEQVTLQRAIAFYKEHRGWIHDAETYFLDHSETCIVARLVVMASQQRALLVVAQIDDCSFAVPAPLRLAGLNPSWRYRLSHVSAEDYVVISSHDTHGAVLQTLGMQIPLMQPDSASLFLLDAIGK